MVAAPDRRLSALSHADSPLSAVDARLFSLIEEVRGCEKRRDELLDRLTIEHGEQIGAAAKKACDAARAIYERIAAIKPTTRAGVLRQLELAATGWVAPTTVAIAIAALREIADRPPPFKMGRLPPVPAEALGIGRDERCRTDAALKPPRYWVSGDIPAQQQAQHGARPVPESPELIAANRMKHILPQGGAFKSGRQKCAPFRE